jgi:hypothetical protein
VQNVRAVIIVPGQRGINGLVFDDRSAQLAVAAEYRSAPYVASLKPHAETRELGPVEKYTSLKHVAFTPDGGTVCGTFLSAAWCWELATGAATAVAKNDFRWSARDLRGGAQQLIAAGERSSVLLQTLDLQGVKKWELTLDRTSVDS